MPRNVTAEPLDPRERFGLYRLCDCPTCEGKGKVDSGGELVGIPGKTQMMLPLVRCPDCRGEGRVRQEVASCESPEAVGVALVTLAREGEFEECPLGLLDRMPECETCEGWGIEDGDKNLHDCPECKGSGVKPSGTWLILPWLPSPRERSNLPASDALRYTQLPLERRTMYHDEAYEVKIESDEDGFHLILKCEALDLNIRIQDVAEQLHDAVRADIAPWLRERDEASLTYEPARQIAEFNRAAREAYGISDPKHPDFHSIHADIWDSREGK